MSKYMAVAAPYQGWDWIEGSSLAMPSSESMHIINADADGAARAKADRWAADNGVEPETVNLFRLEEVNMTTIDIST